MHWQTYALAPLEAGEKQEFQIDESSSRHSAKTADPRGRAPSFPRQKGEPEPTMGRYTGYIVTVEIGEQIVATKSIPSTYEDDPLAIEKLAEQFPPPGTAKK